MNDSSPTSNSLTHASTSRQGPSGEADRDGDDAVSNDAARNDAVGNESENAPDETQNHDDPRLHEVQGDAGFPGEVIEGEANQPGSQEIPDDVEPSTTPITDARSH